MNDRELLEAAAKAAGYTLDRHTQKPHAFCYGGIEWNPLTSDGDALRLAVKLGLQVKQYPIYETPKFAAYVCEAKWRPDVIQLEVGAEALEQYNGDPYAATRRSIVRAAASIGEKME